MTRSCSARRWRARCTGAIRWCSQRLLLNMRFLDPQPEDSDEAAASSRRSAMGMHAQRPGGAPPPGADHGARASQEGADRAPASDAELAAMYAERREELALPARWRITQVYFSADRRKERAPRPMRAPRWQRLQREALAPEAALALGDPFLGGHQLPLLNALQLAGQFGEDFARGHRRLRDRAMVRSRAIQLRRAPGARRGSRAGRVPGLDEPDVRRRLESDVLRERAPARAGRGDGVAAAEIRGAV